MFLDDMGELLLVNRDDVRIHGRRRLEGGQWGMTAYSGVLAVM